MRTVTIIFLTFLLAFVLEILPLPIWLAWFRPEWALLILIYWILASPHKIGVNVAFCVGLILDLLKGTLLGEHGLALVLIAYFLGRFYTRIRLSPIWQQALLVFILVLFYQTVQFWVGGLLGVSPGTWLYWMPSITTALLWPWICALLKGYRRRYRMIY